MTVNFDEVRERLATRNVAIDAAKLEMLRTIQKIRNGTEHYELVLNLEQAKAVIGELAGFLHTFCIDHLDLFIEDRFSDAARAGGPMSYRRSRTILQRSWLRRRTLMLKPTTTTSVSSPRSTSQ